MFIKKTVISTRFKSVFVASMVSILNAYILALTDNVVAGQFVGEQAVAAMTLIFPIFTFLLFVSYLIADGLVMMVSYAQGKNDLEEVDRLFSLGVILSIVSSIIFFTALYFFRDTIIDFWEIAPDLQYFAREYYSGLIFVSLVLFANIFIATIFIAQGMERYSIIASATAFIINVILDILLCQLIGVRGIGLATASGTLVSLCLQSYFLQKKCNLHFKMYWNWQKVWKGIVISFYHSMDTLFISILPILLSMQIINYFGDEKLIIVTVAVNILTLIIGIYTGIVDCIQPMICQYYAENNLHSIIKTMRLSVQVTIVIGLILTLVGIIFANFLPEMFGVKDPNLAEEIATAMRYFLPFTIFLGLVMVIAHYYIYIEKLNFGAFIKTLLFLILPVFGMILGGQFHDMNIFWISVGSSFLATYIVNLILTKNFGKRSGLLMIESKNLKRQISYDINSTADEVMALTKKVDEDLKLRIVDDKVRNKVVLCIEEFGLHAAARAGEKIFQLEFSILLDDKVTLIIRDNGESYDIMTTAQENKFSFREFFIESVTQKFFNRHYFSTYDENRVILKI